MHTPVLLDEALDGLNIKSDGIYIDATVGEGGHLFEIGKRGGRVLGIDLDNNQIENLNLNVKNLKNITLVSGNFAEIEEIAKDNLFYPIDGILMDLGLSIGQIENSGRGFSYKKLDDPLDMRINTAYETIASELLNTLNENALYEILAKYGEDVHSLKISREIIKNRQRKRIERVGDLLTAIDKAVGGKDRRTYARIFQALRITVNNELDNLHRGLEGSLKILKKSGRLVVVTFHSIEDRKVKQFILKNNLNQLNKKVITAKSSAVFERSAKIRIIEKS